MSEQRDTIQQYVSDMLGVEQHIHQAIERQSSSDALSDFPEAAQIIRRAGDTLDNHVNALDSYLKEIGGDMAAPVKEAVMAALGVIAGFIDNVRTEKVSKMLRDDYTAFSLAAISYHMLHTTAVAFGDHTTAHLALRHLKDWTRLITDISHVIHPTVARDLENDGFTVASNAAKQSEEATQEAWSPSHVS